MNDPVVDILREFDPDPSAALRAASASACDEDIERIALADYGMDYGENIRVLRDIWKTCETPYPLPCSPKEVCQLTHWSMPKGFAAGEGRALGDDEAALHRQRAFACSILLRFGYDDHRRGSGGGFSMGEGGSAAVMVASAIVLAGEFVRATRQTLAAVAMVMAPGEAERGILMLGVLLCAVREGEPAIPGERLNRLAWALIGEEQRQRDSGHAMGWAWLFSATYFDRRTPMWRSMARALLLEPSRPHPKEADEVLRLIGAVACEG